MSIVACVKVQDGIVIGCDSATQIFGKDDKGNTVVLKVYENARKLFRFENLSVGILTYGIGNIGKKSIQTILREFSDASVFDASDYEVKGLASRLFVYMKDKYDKEFGDLDEQKKPVLGMYIAGYSSKRSQGEEWEFQIPEHSAPIKVRPSDDVGASWRGAAIPFTRLYYGYDPRVMSEYKDKGIDIDIIEKINTKYSTNVIYPGMPVKDAVRLVQFIMQTTIGLNSFEIGVPSCSEPIQIAVIDAKKGFTWITKPSLEIQGG